MTHTYQSVEDLEIWKIAHRVALDTYQFSSQFPKHELFGLTSQLRRAAVSVPANIAEGYGRKSKKEFIQFIVISLGSLEEVRYYYILALELAYISQDDKDKMIGMIELLKGKLNAFRNSLINNLKTLPNTKHLEHST